MFCLLVLPTIIFAYSAPLSQSAAIAAQTERIIALADDEVKARLASLDHQLIEYRLEPAVKAIIGRYLHSSGSNASLIIGRSARYFPLFDQLLTERSMPAALKYLAIAESALRCSARSRVGATGLWQLMPGTARELGLRIDDYVDERLEPYQATEAALKYLRRLHDHYQDWGLTFAAYNAGPGRVNGALRRGRGRTYWSVRANLPRETQLYVPAFIAAAYLAEFYAHHGVAAAMPPLDYQLTEAIRVEHPLSFYRVAQVTGLSIRELEDLNPAYLQGYLPGYKKGHYLMLPRRAAGALRAYLATYAANGEEAALPFLPRRVQAYTATRPNSEHYAAASLPLHGDSIEWEATAHTLGVPTHLLRTWNPELVASDTLVEQALVYYTAHRTVAMARATPVWSTDAVPALVAQGLDYDWVAHWQERVYRDLNLVFYLHREISLQQLGIHFPGLNIAAVARINGLAVDIPLKVGTQLHIPPSH